MKRRTNLSLIFLFIVVSIIFSSCASMKNRKIENGIVYSTYSGANYVSVLDITFKAGKNVVIPAEHNGLPITILDEHKSLYLDSYARYETLILPESIERIDDSFYYNASNKLQDNEYGNGLYLGTKDNPYFALIENFLFGSYILRVSILFCCCFFFNLFLIEGNCFIVLYWFLP